MRWKTAVLGVAVAVLAWVPAVVAQPGGAWPETPWTAQIERDVTPPADVTPSAAPHFSSTVLAERTVQGLPASPLFWRVERFSTPRQAEEGQDAHGLVAMDSSGGNWLMTLGASRDASTGADLSTRVGPVAAFGAPEYLVRITQVSGPRGSASAVVSHPGSLAAYVLAGQMCARTPSGQTRLNAGEGGTLTGPDSAIQISSCGGGELLALVMSVTDAARPFSSPARFPAPAPQPATPEPVGPGRD